MNRIAILLLLYLLLSTPLAVAEDPYPVDWIQQFGGINTDEGRAVAVDNAGSVFVGGFSLYTEPFFSTFINTAPFITKFDAATGEELWTFRDKFGTHEFGLSLAVDHLGNSFLTGYEGLNIHRDIFLTKVDPQGNQVWTREFGNLLPGGSDDLARAVAVDGAGNVYLTGKIEGTGDPVPDSPFFFDTEDAFVAKFDTDGNELWTERITNGFDNVGIDFAVDDAGNSHVLWSEGNQFITKFDTNGNELWTEETQFGVSNIALDATGNIYLSSTAGSRTPAISEPFLTKLSPSGAEIWTSNITATINERITGESVVVEGDGSVLVSGYVRTGFRGQDLEAFLAKYDSNGTILWTDLIGTNNAELGYGVAVDNTGDVFLAGYTGGRLDGTSAGSNDAFLVKFTNNLATADSVVVPEPTTLILLLFAIPLLAIPRRCFSVPNTANNYLIQRRFSKPFCVLAILLATTPLVASAQPPGLGPGDSYHLMFVTSGTTSLSSLDTTLPPLGAGGSWGGIPAARWTVTFAAYNATGVNNGLGAGRLPGQPYNPSTDKTYADLDLRNQWNFVSPIWQTVLSDSGFTDLPGMPGGRTRHAFDLLNIDGPIYDTVGQLIATDKVDLFDFSIGAPLNHTEHGVPHTGITDVWTGTSGAGTFTGDDCLEWQSAGNGTAAIGRTDSVTSSWVFTNLRPCTSSARLYALSPLFTIPQPGDFDGDGDVDGADFLAWQRNDGTAAGLAAWQENYGAQPDPLAASHTVPEPATLLLALLLATTAPCCCRRKA